MKFDEIKQLIELFSKSDVDRLKIEEEGFCIALGKKKAVLAAVPDAVATQVAVASVSQPALPEAEPEHDEKLIKVTSPIVGTFYRSPTPNGEPFVKLGSTVSKGQTLCIVEAMKLMNEIQAEEEGVIAKIYVENGIDVEYGTLLFGIRPN